MHAAPRSALRSTGLLGLGFAWVLGGLLQAGVIERAAQLERDGRFRDAETALEQALGAPHLGPEHRLRLEEERERLRRIRLDYPLTRATLWTALDQSLADASEAEFERWLGEGRFDSLDIDGTRWYADTAISNLYYRHPEIDARRRQPKSAAAKARVSWENAIAIRDAARQEQRPYVLPKRLHVTMTLTVPAGAVAAGTPIRAWFPVPRRYGFQDDFTLLGTSSPVQALADPESPIRSAYLEQPADTGAETRLWIEYAYTAWGVHFDIAPDRVVLPRRLNADLARHTREEVHVQFTGPLRALARDIAGTERNPARLAHRFYDWIAHNIRYSYSPEYGTIRNLSDYCLSHRYGDCGQQAFLFIALCRLHGIPARWQSGWSLFPGSESIHDWCEIHLPPYGWVPVDPYMGGFATQYATDLDPAQRHELREFYFGGLSQYRLSANRDHNQALTPPKNSLRSDPVDFQRGELEAAGRNLYFPEFGRRLVWKEIKP